MTVDMTKLMKEALAGELAQLRDAVRTTAEPLSEEQFWRRPIEPGNSLGHLVLHLTGNLNYMVGACLGGTGYTRDREREFTEQNVPAKAEALAKLDDAVAMFRRVVEGLGEEQLAAPHPVTRLGRVLPALLHLVAHFAIHRGQMSYITRLVSAGTDPVKA
ncbi:MAG: DUF664 domain-containing protein [Planctomycetes bacterium]|nr:DUF664 domain-containing protein [Planctomycetota bacterium]